MTSASSSVSAECFSAWNVACLYTGTVLGFFVSLAASFLPFYGVARVLSWVGVPSSYSLTLSGLSFVALAVFAYVTRTRTTHVRRLQPPAERKIKTVSIIGAGVSGIVAAKELLDEGFDVHLYERETWLGGIWKTGKEASRVYSDIISTSSSYITSFSDLLPRESNPSLHHPYHLTAEEYTEYVNRYADRHHLRDRTTFNVTVDHARRKVVDGREVWELEVEDRQTGERRTVTSDALVYAGGTNQAPRWIYPKNHEKFKGTTYHSMVYKTPEIFKDRKVLVIGIGDSAGDMVMHIGEVAEHVYYSLGKGAVVAPRMMHGTPIDYNNHCFFYCLPLRIRNFIRDTIVRKMVYHTDERYGEVVADLDSRVPQGFSERTRFIMKTGRFIEPVLSGKASLHYRIQTCTEKGVVFEDGTEVEVDDIVLCTGFDRDAYMFRDSFPNQRYKLEHERYLSFLEPSLPDCAFVGFIRPSGAGAVGPLAEMQSRLLAQVWAGKVSVGSDEEVLGFCRRYELWYNQEKTKTLNKQCVQWAQYLDEVARVLGCSPPLTRYYFLEPFKWAKLMMAPFTSHRYRLVGPHACPKAFDEMVDGLSLLPTVQSCTPALLVRKGAFYGFTWFACTFWSAVTRQEALAPAMYSFQYVY